MKNRQNQYTNDNNNNETNKGIFFFLTRERERQRQIESTKQSETQGKVKEAGRIEERDRENSELYYARIEILGICLFLQSVLANVHASPCKDNSKKID